MDHTACSGKAKGSGVCFLIKNSWCSDIVTLASHCSPDLEYLTVRCQPYYRPREFTSVILTAVYIQPRADVKNALDMIYTTTNTRETKFPEALFIVASNFNQVNLKQVMPKYHQHMSYPDRRLNILDHCYTTIKDTYRSISHPHFGKSDLSTVFLLRVYKQKLKWENPSQKEGQCCKTKELIIDFRKKEGEHAPIDINGTEVER
eukprot:g48222.t1